jgi:hypothetical protein
MSTGSIDFGFRFDLTPAASPVPEPQSMALLGSSLLAFVIVLRKQRSFGECTGSNERRRSCSDS